MKSRDATWLLIEAHRAGLFDAAWRLFESRSYKRDNDGQFATTNTSGGGEKQTNRERGRETELRKRDKQDNREPARKGREQNRREKKSADRQSQQRASLPPYQPVHSALAARTLAMQLRIESVNVPAYLNRPIYQQHGVLTHTMAPLHALASSGGPMPKGLSFDRNYFKGSRQDGEFDNTTGTIHINPDGASWDEATRTTQFESGLFSTVHPQGTLYHEYAHSIVHQTDSGLYLAYRDPDGLFSQHSREFASMVSDYAGENALEFISETFAALRTGRHFDRSVMRCYNALAPKPLRRLT